MLVALVAGACSPSIDDWPGYTAIPKSNEIEWRVAHHELSFSPGSRWLAPGELSRLDGFLSGIDLRRPNHVYVASAAAGVSDELAQQRAQTLNGLLRARGVAVRADPPQVVPGAGTPDGPSRADAARLLIGYYAVTTPGCPDWRKPTSIDFSNQPSSNFGCANQINLGLMVADPRDLLRGRAEGSVNGQRAALAVQDYRAGDAPALADQAEEPGGLPLIGGGG